MIYKWINGLLFYQIEPSFFYNRMDVFTWLFMQTKLPIFLLNNPAGWLCMDMLFYIMPCIYFLVFLLKPKTSTIVCLLMLLINWLYVQCYTLYPSNSIEGHIAWLLFPIVLLPQNEKTFALVWDGLRYFFLFFFCSAGIWKFVQQGIFNPQQMSGVLLYQHKQLISNSPGYWQTNLINYLIDHPTLGYALYLLTTIFELFFAIGFFTKKFDRVFIALFIIFLIADYFIMRIPYFEVLPLMLTLLIKPPKTASNG
jgi:hypothetical protein